MSVAFSRLNVCVCAHTTHSVKPLYEHTKLKNEISFDLSLWLFSDWTGNIVCKYMVMPFELARAEKGKEHLVKIDAI